MALKPEKDGWRLAGGRPTRMFDARGNSKFDSDYSLFQYIAARADGDEDYRELYLRLPWMTTDQLAANRQGWYLRVDSQGAHIRSVNGYVMTDEAAQQFVKDRANEQDVVCIKALHVLARARLRSV